MASETLTRRSAGPRAAPGWAELAAAALAAAGIVLLLRLLLPSILRDVEARTVDWRYRARQWLGRSPAATNSVVLIDMDDDSVRELGRTPWPRSRHAEAIRKLSAAGAGAIVYDLFFAQPTTPDEDTPFIEAVRESGRAVAGLPVRLAEVESGSVMLNSDVALEALVPAARFPDRARPLQVTQLQQPMAGLASALRSIGHISGDCDPDGVFRRFPLVVSLNGRPVPSLGLTGACLVLGADPARLTVEPSAIVIPGPQGEIRIPVDNRFRAWLDYPGPFWTTFVHVSFHHILRLPQQELAALVKDRLCLISMASTGSDLGATPLEVNIPRSVLHATVASSVLTRQFVRGGPVWLDLLGLLLVTAAMLAMARALSVVSFLAACLALLSIVLLAIMGSFAYAGFVVKATEPLLLAVMMGLGLLQTKLVWEAQNRRAVEQTFSRYFSPQIVARILKNPESLQLGTQRKELTVMFSDIKGFTTISENLDPDDLQELLREYFDRMTEIVFRHGGTVDKFIGDGMLAFFGDPEWFDDHAVRAVKAALDMQRAVREFSAARKAAGKQAIEIRIGINTGRVAVGNLGASRRLEYSVIGRAVNQAQRLESAAPVGGILIGARTRALLGDQIPAGPPREIQVKGVDHPIEVFEVPVA